MIRVLIAEDQHLIRGALVALIGLMNTLIVSVMERFREIGVLRAIGMSRGQLQRLVMFESALQGVLGSATALVLGSWIAQFWMSRSLSAVLGWIITFHYPWTAVGTTLLELHPSWFAMAAGVGGGAADRNTRTWPATSNGPSRSRPSGPRRPVCRWT